VCVCVCVCVRYIKTTSDKNHMKVLASVSQEEEIKINELQAERSGPCGGQFPLSR
jgi:hypothetical protein